MSFKREFIFHTIDMNLYLINNFSGGLADEDLRGIAGAFRWGEQLDYRTDPSFLTGVNAPTKITTTIIADVPKWILNFGNSIYCLAANNHIYKEGSPWTDAHTNVQTGVGNGFAVMGTKLYYASNAKLGSYDGAATWTDALQTFASGTAGEWHPMKLYSPSGGLCIGDGRYVAVLDYDGITYADGATPTVNGGLTLPLGERVKALEVFGDYLVIGCWKGTNIYDNNEATLYFWDGTATTYNFKVTLYESGINALLTTSYGLLICAGVKGNLYMYNGGNPVLIKQIPGMTKTNTLYNDIFPGAVANYKGLPMIGVCGAGDDTATTKGVYSFGSINKNYPPTLNLDYLISTGTKTGTTTFVSAIAAISDQEFYIGWRDGAAYGIDLVHATNKVASATYQSLWFDGRIPFQEKDFKSFFMTYNDLAATESITLSYRKDTETSWTTIGVVNDDGENFRRIDYGIRCRRIQFRIVLAGTNVLPKLKSFGAFYSAVDLQS
jgi:hypothetical protein